MPATDTTEAGLEALICRLLVDEAGYVAGDPKDYDREHALDWPKLLGFLKTTQPKVVAAMDLDIDSPKRTKFLARLTGEISKRGVVDVLRKGISDGPMHVDVFYGMLAVTAASELSGISVQVTEDTSLAAVALFMASLSFPSDSHRSALRWAARS